MYYTGNQIIEALFNDNSNIVEHIPILSASFSRILEHIYSGAPILIISAFTSAKENLTEEELEAHRIRNIGQTKKLAEDIIDKHLSFVVIDGNFSYIDQDDEGNDIVSSSESEKSFFVIGRTRQGEIVDFNQFKQLSLEWCGKYNQQCVLVGKALQKNDKLYFSDKDDVIYYEYLDRYGNNVKFNNKWAKYHKLKVASNEDIAKIVKEYYSDEGLGYSTYKNNSFSFVSSIMFDKKHLNIATGDLYNNDYYGLCNLSKFDIIDSPSKMETLFEQFEND